MALDAPSPEGEIPFHPPEHPTWMPGGVDGVPPLAPDRACRRCLLHRGVKTVCMPGVGPAGAGPQPLLVMGTPTSRDDGAGGLVQAGGNALAIEEARRHGDFSATWALRCASGRDADDAALEACRGYLAAEVDAASRVVALGPLAALALTGFSIDSKRRRRARAVVRGKPLFVVADPASVARNRFWKGHFKSDVEWAMTAPAEAAPDGVVRILGPAAAATWLGGGEEDSPRPGRPVVVDAEHWPKNPWAPGEFRLLCLGLCTDVRAPRVISEEVLKMPAVRAALKAVMEDASIPKVNQAIKHDRHVLWRALGIDVIGVEHDTLIFAKLLDSENPAGLGALNWKTGFGGYKELGQAGADDEDDE